MKKIAVTVAVLALGLAACEADRDDNAMDNEIYVENEAADDVNLATDDMNAAAAADNALDDAGNAVDEAGEAIENAADDVADATE